MVSNFIARHSKSTLVFNGTSIDICGSVSNNIIAFCWANSIGQQELALTPQVM